MTLIKLLLGIVRASGGISVVETIVFETGASAVFDAVGSDCPEFRITRYQPSTRSITSAARPMPANNLVRDVSGAGGSGERFFQAGSAAGGTFSVLITFGAATLAPAGDAGRSVMPAPSISRPVV